MTPLMQLISSLTDDEKIQLISILSEKMLYPETIDAAKRLIRAIVNHI
ncbi:hypothetical protein [Phormidesmis priestleyi]|nr:hypothetical protein [Phormidesmis priestleyi]